MNNFKKLLKENISTMSIPKHINDIVLKMGIDLKNVSILKNHISVVVDSLSKEQIQLLIKNKSFVKIDCLSDSYVNIKFNKK